MGYLPPTLETEVREWLDLTEKEVKPRPVQSVARPMNYSPPAEKEKKKPERKIKAERIQESGNQNIMSFFKKAAAKKSAAASK